MSVSPTRYGQPLSARELQIMRHVAAGLTATAIGHQLFLAEDTVKCHLRRIFCKLGASNRAHAVALTIGAGHDIQPAPRRAA